VEVQKDIRDRKMIVHGKGASVELSSDQIIIRRRGVLSALSVGLAGEKFINIADISSIQLKEGNFITSGFIHFGYRGGFDRVNGLFDAAKDENSVMFEKRQTSDFLRLKKAIEDRRAEIIREQKSHTQVSMSVADEIAKFAKLRDQGLLTSAEFEMKKKQLLGL
jgi:hypothetical protein